VPGTRRIQRLQLLDSPDRMGPNSGVQEYCLRWNNHHSTLVSVMDALLQKGTLVDVTLAAEGKSIQVHRLVLCACSNYFQELLSLHWDKQAVVILKDVKFEHLQALVDYMYRGEVNVSQDQLAAFLATAEALLIKGLADGDRDRKNEKRILEKAMNRSSSPSSVSRAPKRIRKQSKEDSPPAPEKNQLPHHQLPSLVRIPPITSNDSNDRDSPCPDSPIEHIEHIEHDINSNPMTDNLNIEIEDGEEYSMVEPKIEAELEADYSGGSGDEEDWSDSEFPSRIDTSHGETTWNDELGQAVDHEGNLIPGQSHMDHDMNNSARVKLKQTEEEEEEEEEAEGDRFGHYPCIRCGRIYTRRDNRNRHVRLECGQTPRFSCPICYTFFSRKNNVTRHLARKHNVKTNVSSS